MSEELHFFSLRLTSPKAKTSCFLPHLPQQQVSHPYGGEWKKLKRTAINLPDLEKEKKIERVGRGVTSVRKSKERGNSCVGVIQSGEIHRRLSNWTRAHKLFPFYSLCLNGLSKETTHLCAQRENKAKITEK